jgi:hypothetical protein
MRRRFDWSQRIIVAVTVMASAMGATCGERETAPAATFAIALNNSSVKAGAPLDVTYAFTATGDVRLDESYWVMAHFVAADGEILWIDDHEPPTPTAAWKPGEAVQYNRTLFVPGALPPGDVSLIVGLYSPETERRLPLSGREAEPRAYRGGTFHLEPADILEYTDGWYDLEGQARDPVRWRWTKRQATVRFRNPKVNAIVYLEVAAADQFPSAPQVTVSIGGPTVDQFDAPLQGRVLRRIPVPAEAFGSGEMVDAIIAVDRTFSPATIAGGSSVDSRQLGVRVFNVAIQPDR